MSIVCGWPFDTEIFSVCVSVRSFIRPDGDSGAVSINWFCAVVPFAAACIE